MKQKLGEEEEEGQLIRIGAEFLKSIREFHYKKESKLTLSKLGEARLSLF